MRSVKIHQSEFKIQRLKVRYQQVIVSSVCRRWCVEGPACSVRLCVDPSVQAAGEHHSTDLKTGSVRSKRTAQSPWRTAGSSDAVDCEDREGLKVMGLEWSWLLWGCQESSSRYCSSMCVHRLAQADAQYWH